MSACFIFFFFHCFFFHSDMDNQGLTLPCVKEELCLIYAFSCLCGLSLQKENVILN
jgi:hypothetical protein